MNKLILFLALGLMSIGAMAQQRRSVYLGVSTHWINLNDRAQSDPFNDYLKDEKWQLNLGPTKLLVGIPISNKASIMPTASFGAIKVPNQSNSSAFWNLDVNIAVSAFKKAVEPYIMAGVGTTRLAGVSYLGVNGGLGLNFWIFDELAINAQTNFNYLFDAKENPSSYFQNSIGLVLKLGGGPKDSDKDGIADEQDACPQDKGTAATKGCPDSDGDGVADKDDSCPSEAGTVATKGCPDSDNDGVANAQDVCPNEAGKPENGGCPDSDGDGVLDKDDSCPQVSGSKSLAGCPDNDGDGVADKDDACPEIAGPVANKGCPVDRDNDGVADNIDNCPDLAGVAANKGCPEVKVEDKKKVDAKLNMAAKLIQFETGSATIKQLSYQQMDNIIVLMNQYPGSRFKIEGHTDNTGNAAANTALSTKRADAVKAYIVGKGIDEDRLVSEGYGSSRPIATNATAVGRTKNRRVEIHLVE